LDKTFSAFFVTVAFLSCASSKNVIQIRKYCPVGQVLSKFPAGDKCLKVVAGKNWKGFLYDSETLKKLDPSKDEQIQRKYLDSNFTCEDDDWVRLTAKPSGRKENDEPLFILLTNGKLMWRSDNCTSKACKGWETFPAQFYIDGIGYPENGSKRAFYSGHEEDQLLYYCNSHLLVRVLTYYFFNSCYSWTVLLNFDLWWSFSSNVHSSMVPNYGTDCFMAASSHYVYLVLVQFIFLVPGLIFGILTFYALYQVRMNAGPQQGSKSTSSFQLNFKLFVILGLGWVLNILLAVIIIPNLSGVESEVLLILELLVLLLDSLGTAILTFWIYVCKKSTLGKLEQKYPRFHGFAKCLRAFKQRFVPTAPSSSIDEADSKTHATSNSSTNV
ncbi:hypothetical protein Ocin01_07896, partial [Orchesella cincta]